MNLRGYVYIAYLQKLDSDTAGTAISKTVETCLVALLSVLPKFSVETSLLEVSMSILEIN